MPDIQEAVAPGLRAGLPPDPLQGLPRGRQQHARLDVDERCGHNEEFRSNLEVELLHDFEILEILLRDFCNRDVVDINLVLLEQMQQQIERPLKGGNLDAIE